MFSAAEYVKAEKSSHLGSCTNRHTRACTHTHMSVHVHVHTRAVFKLSFGVFLFLESAESHYVALGQRGGGFGGAVRATVEPWSLADTEADGGVVVQQDGGIYSRPYLKPAPGKSMSWQTTKE